MKNQRTGRLWQQPTTFSRKICVSDATKCGKIFNKARKFQCVLKKGHVCTHLTEWDGEACTARARVLLEGSPFKTWKEFETCSLGELMGMSGTGLITLSELLEILNKRRDLTVGKLVRSSSLKPLKPMKVTGLTPTERLVVQWGKERVKPFTKEQLAERFNLRTETSAQRIWSMKLRGYLDRVDVGLYKVS